MTQWFITATLLFAVTYGFSVEPVSIDINTESKLYLAESTNQNGVRLIELKDTLFTPPFFSLAIQIDKTGKEDLYIRLYERRAWYLYYTRVDLVIGKKVYQITLSANSLFHLQSGDPMVYEIAMIKTDPTLMEAVRNILKTHRSEVVVYGKHETIRLEISKKERLGLEMVYTRYMQGQK